MHRALAHYMLLKMSDVLNLCVAVGISLLPMAVQQYPRTVPDTPTTTTRSFHLTVSSDASNKLR